jgi:hypothetical protein
LTAAAVQPVIALPPAENETVPPGAMGVNDVPPSAAVKVTAVFTAADVTGEAVTARVGSPFDTVSVIPGEVAVLKFESPE